MSIHSDRARRLFELSLRSCLAAVFLWAAVTKLRDPTEFAIEIGHYDLFPELAPYLAASLPAAELVLGASLLAFPSVWRRAAALGCLLLMVMFTGAATSAYARGLDIDCGCFGKGTGPITWLTLARDAALIAACVLVVRLTPNVHPKQGSPTSTPG